MKTTQTLRKQKILRFVTESLFATFNVTICTLGIIGWYFTHAQSGNLAFTICGLSVLMAIAGVFDVANQCRLIKGGPR